MRFISERKAETRNQHRGTAANARERKAVALGKAIAFSPFSAICRRMSSFGSIASPICLRLFPSNAPWEPGIAR